MTSRPPKPVETWIRPLGVGVALVGFVMILVGGAFGGVRGTTGYGAHVLILGGVVALAGLVAVYTIDRVHGE